jgi:hypothetical protein
MPFHHHQLAVVIANHIVVAADLSVADLSVADLSVVDPSVADLSVVVIKA